jgi:pyroglutamyl-peptidase
VKLLLTGFVPWAQHSVNPSEVAAHAAAERLGPPVTAVSLPVDFHLAREPLREHLAAHRPTHCLSMGLAGVEHFRIEHLARKPEQFAALPGADSYPGAFPWDALRQCLETRGAVVADSSDAGRYVCESTYWVLLDHRAREGYPAHAGFLHVPAVSDACPLADTVEHVVAAVEALLTHGGG